MGRLAGQLSPLNLSIAVLLLLVAIGGFWWRAHRFEPASPPPDRPSAQDMAVYDYAGILRAERAETAARLRSLQRRCGFEMLVVTVGALPDGMAIDMLARTLLDNWQIGRNDRGGGVLVVATREKRARLLVTGTLADVFSGAFCARIERELLPAYLSRDEPAAGISAVLDAVENRFRESEPPPAERKKGGSPPRSRSGQRE